MEKQTEVAGVEFNPPTATVSGADINDKLAAAQAAMAGPERLAKQEEANKKDGARKEQSELEKKISLLDQQKSALELEWITLDDKRKELNTKLTPLLTDEKALEEEEAKNELEEARAAGFRAAARAEHREARSARFPPADCAARRPRAVLETLRARSLHGGAGRVHCARVNSMRLRNSS
ncbi:MAG: hypothetical protein AAB589_02785, partial [Patescibacteria group bacterium]